MSKKDHHEPIESRDRRIPIRFFSRKPVQEHGEHASNSEAAPLEPLPTDEKARADSDAQFMEELDRAIDESCEELAKHEPSNAAPAADRAGDLERENVAIQERLLRLAAEFDNYRKRVERDRSAERDRARGKIVEALLPIIDDFQRALQTAKTDNASASLVAGLDLIARQLEELLTSFNVRPIETVGRSFDPSLHEAIAASAQEDLPENTIVEEYQRGYLIGDQLLRPARVKVVTH